MFKMKYKFIINRDNYITIQIKKWWWNRWRTVFYIDRDINNIDTTTEIPTEVHIDIKKDLKSVKFNCVKDAENFINDLKQKSKKEKDYYYYKLGKIKGIIKIMTKNKKNIWHKNTEEPEEDKQVLVCFDNRFCYVCFYHKDEYRFYNDGKPSFSLPSITKWMYVDELL